MPRRTRALQFFIILSILLTAAPAVLAQNTENPYEKKEILVFTPTWSDPDAVMPFLQDKVENLMLESPGPKDWKFLQVGYIPLYLRTHIRKAENNYSFQLTVTLRNGEELFKLEGACEICNTSEALERLSELKAQVCDKLEEKAVEAARLAKDQPPKPPVEVKPPVETGPRIVGVLGEPEPFRMPPFDRTPPQVKLWSWMGASLSLTAVVTGIILLAIDDDFTCDAPYPTRQCQERYATGAAGWTFLLTGLAGGGLSGWSLYNLYSKKPSIVPRVVPSAAPGKAAINLEWRF